uniref:Uncharacterized protein n=1 Tax=Bionectria ochroleuca TaxID=29856 RepID=A0A0B7KEQ9_BIOOC
MSSRLAHHGVRIGFNSRIITTTLKTNCPLQRHQHVGQRRWNSSRDVDPRIKALGRTILDDYAAVREEYGTNPNLTAVNPIRKHQQLTTSPATPTYPIVLAHGLLGFSEIKLAQALPSLQYWHGIQDALEQAGATVITATRAGFGTQAFSQLTREYMTQTFNATVRDRDDVRYFSYGAMMDEPALLSPRWGTYKGTLVGVSHLDLINWSNRVRWTVREWMGVKRTFNAIAFYLDIADMLAKEGL